MYRLIKSETVDMTHELATRFKDMQPWTGERLLEKGRVKHLREKAQKGLLVPFGWAYAIYNGQEYRINAQHSSTMLHSLNGQFPEGCRAHIAVFEVDSMKDLALLFRQYDDRKSSRSPLDISGCYQGLFAPLQGVTRQVGKLAIEGIVWHDFNVVAKPVPSGDDIYELFEDKRYHPFIQWLGTLFNSKCKELQRKDVVAAMYGTYLANQEKAREFWMEAAHTMGGLDDNGDGDPPKVLDNWLRGLAEKVDKKLLDLKPANYYQGCVFAWNAYLANKTITAICFDARKGFYDVERG